jgi:putative tricarboxylic transport membrane protein
VVGLISLLGSIGYLTIALGMPQGSAVAPGPGMFPVVVGAAAIAISLIVILEAILSSAVAGPIEWPAGAERSKVLVFLGTLIGYVLLLPMLGQYLASAAFASLFLRTIGGLTLPKSLAFGVLIGCGLSWFFASVMGLSLPEGLWR